MEILNNNDFKEKYDAHIKNNVFPKVIPFEKEREIRLAWVAGTLITCSLLIIISIILLPADNEFVKWLFAINVVIILSVKPLTKKAFEDKVKKIIMPTIMEHFPGFFWQKEPSIKPEEIRKCNIIPTEGMEHSFDDSFIGKYKDINITISECKYYVQVKGHDIDFFRGVIVKLDMNKRFSGNTVIRPRNVLRINSEVDLQFQNMSKVNLEDPSFNEKFFVYSTDQIEARYLITPTFMERLNATGEAFDTVFECCSFYENSIYIGLNIGKDMFDLCDLDTPMDNKEQYDIIYKEFEAILALVDHFKLDKKLGL